MSEKHPIYEIAEKLKNCEVSRTDVTGYHVRHLTILKDDKLVTDILSATGDTPEEAKDSLLQKLQAIVCPDYLEIKNNYLKNMQPDTRRLLMQRDKLLDKEESLEAEISSLKQKLQESEQREKEAFEAGQNSIGYRDECMSRIDKTWQDYKERK